MNDVVKLGLVMSGIGIILALVYKMVNPNFMFSGTSIGISLLVTAVIAVYFGRRFLRNPEEGRLGYGQAIKKLFMAFLITVVISAGVNNLMYGGDENLMQSWDTYQEDMQISGARLGAKIAGGSEAEQDAAEEKIREMIDSGEIQKQSYPFTWSQFPMALVNGAVMYLLLALLLALFVRER